LSIFTLILGCRSEVCWKGKQWIYTKPCLSKTNDTLREIFLQELFRGGSCGAAVRRLKPHCSIDLIYHIGYPFGTGGGPGREEPFPVIFKVWKVLDRALGL
jgi:hypothetical protein